MIKKTNGGKTCAYCKWWVEHTPIVGECRREPPSIIQLDGDADFCGRWPETEFDQFCSLWELDDAK